MATSIGVLDSLHFPSALAAAPLAIILIILKRYVSLGSMVFLASVPIAYVLVTRDFKKEYLILTIILALLSIFRHR